MSDFSVVVHDKSRRLEWIQTLGSDSLPVRSFAPEWAEIDGFDEAQPVYFLDLDSLTGEQCERLARHLAAKFGLPLVQVRVRLKDQGVPILAHDCTVTVRNPHKWLV
ncbi:MAG: hypothetical protein FOGNACKC_02259 [Anaerolineae bacterium]|nr:hypothetical protein [Anaerolineae bacterium]